MFKLEKIFQKNERPFIQFYFFLKILAIFLYFYFCAIFENDSIYELKNFEIFKNSFFYSLTLCLSFFCIILYLVDNEYDFKKKISKEYKNDILILLISILIIVLSHYFNFLDVKVYYIFATLGIIIFFFLYNILLKKLYFFLINNNFIQKNIMLVGSYESIIKLLNSKKEKKFIYKCCLITDLTRHKIKFLKSEIKIPIFSIHEDIRSILEYHELGQVWILNNGKEDFYKLLEPIIKFSVDIFIVNLQIKNKCEKKNLINDKFEFQEFEVSKFYGTNLFIKILIDKILSIIFLLFALPILIIASILIYLEDGFPIIFQQDRTGWDGRRFSIYKLRTLKKTKFDKTEQVQKDDQRVLKIGKLLRSFSIDELPQFLNVLDGSMSIVGPRPHMVEHDILYSRLLSEFLKRHKCNPGITGWSQVHGLRGATSKETMKKRMQYDLWYLNNWSIKLDLYIILKTFLAVFKYRGN